MKTNPNEIFKLIDIADNIRIVNTPDGKNKMFVLRDSNGQQIGSAELDALIMYLCQSKLNKK